MTSSINEINTPVVGQHRSQSSSAVMKPSASGREVPVQGSSAIEPSPGTVNGFDGKDGKEKPSREIVKETVDHLNKLVEYLSRRLNFSYDDRIEKVIVKVMEADGEKVIRQIPPEEMIRLSLRMDELMGMLINESV